MTNHRYRSKIAIYDLPARSHRIVFEGEGVIEAPNWARDGSYLLVNRDGDLFRLPLSEEGSARGELQRIRLCDADGREVGYRCNNDHDLSPDGARLAFSAASPTSERSRVYVCGADGSGVLEVTPGEPSYFHGWSPDGQWLAFVAERGDGKYELYRVPAVGGQEERLTSAGGYDDGPEYPPDGRWIYFNSNRSGRWEIWRIPAAGGGPSDELAQQITCDSPEDWFPHVSPDARHLVFLSFPAGTQGHNDKMPGMVLRHLPLPGERIEASKPEVLLEFFGGQGTINVNSWSPDSRRFAFVIYERA